MKLEDIDTLEEYLQHYGPLLGMQAEKTLSPLFSPSRDKINPKVETLLRKPYPPQAAVITAGAKSLRKQKSLILVGACGSGKTLMGQGILHCLAGGRAYRTIVFCPGHLVRKWKREVEETIPDVDCTILSSWKGVVALSDEPRQVKRTHWYIIGRDTAKLGATWRAAFSSKSRMVKKTEEELVQEQTENPNRAASPFRKAAFPYCPDCGRVVSQKTKEGDQGDLISIKSLRKKKHSCEWCGSLLWQFDRDAKIKNRWEPARYIHKHLKGFFDYMILDEMHEEKSDSSSQAVAAGAIIAACKKVIGMTGTLIGGYAEHIRPLMWRLCPSTLVEEGWSWRDATAFSERYGRIETVIKGSAEDGEDYNTMSRGRRSSSKTKYCRPGIVPTLFGDHLIGNSIFIGLEEMSDELPEFSESVIGVTMEPLLASAYAELECSLKGIVSQMMRKGDKRMLGRMLQTLLRYPDHPFGWGNVSCDGMPDIRPENLGKDISAKERELITICQREFALGRQVWVYSIFNDDKNHDVEGRIASLLMDSGLRVDRMRSKDVSPKDREAWIAERGKECDVILSHPKLVETGLDLFDKGWLGHNFCTLVFYETGYQLSTLRQASRRAWRLQQQHECKVFYMYYLDTLQERAMSLMGKKLAAAEALEGKFSNEGLIAMSGDDGMEVALAKSLADGMSESVDRTWFEDAAAIPCNLALETIS